MGIKQLAKLISDNAPGAIRENEMKAYFDRVIAIDASMQLYQFMIAVRQDGQVLTNEAGEVTSHLQGLFSRTIKMMSNSLKPVYVFDGKPPEMKSGELDDRRKKAAEAKEDLKKAEESGNKEDIQKFSKRTVRVTKQHSEDARRLLALMGVPFVDAVCEAEATCAALAASGKAFATATEDMDALTFGTPTLLRYLNAPESRKQPILEFDLKIVLSDLGLTKEQFVDLCILCGCDYCDRIQGIGPVKALTLIKKHGTIEKVLSSLDKTKNKIPENFNFVGARKLFIDPEITDPSTVELKWKDPDVDGLIKFLVDEKGFNDQRVRSSIERLKKSRKQSGQKRLENFFQVTTKRKAPPAKNGKKKKKKGKK